ncbi:MAG: TRAP transporter small permease [Ruminococcaceae bacterium]|nr:TRAP transporter small permease [Oscillospiraceae bacterium]
MKKIYQTFCKFEQIFAIVLLFGIAALVFISAMFRAFKHPLNWAQDAALVAFAWMIFLGSDLAIRNTRLIGIDVIVKYLPQTIQKWLSVLFQIIILAFLCILVRYGYTMVMTGIQRSISTLRISYAWVTASVPVGALLMIVSQAIRMVQAIKTPVNEWGAN